MDGETLIGTSWQAAIENRAALLADPDAQRDYLRELARQERDQLNHEQVVERVELVDAAYRWGSGRTGNCRVGIVSYGRTLGDVAV